ncbi:MAG TPA: hypothetical protein VLT90_04545 [Terriglobales bacterium]|nr:hypothetical protein [Terriglobales bacterium]
MGDKGEDAWRTADRGTQADCDSRELLTGPQKQVLERAVAKLVLQGQRVGVSIDQMILLLGSGLTVGELLEYLADRNGQVS